MLLTTRWHLVLYLILIALTVENRTQILLACYGVTLRKNASIWNVSVLLFVPTQTSQLHTMTLLVKCGQNCRISKMHKGQVVVMDQENLVKM